MTDYHKLRKKIMSLMIGWFLMTTLIIYGVSRWMTSEYNYSTLTATFAIVIQYYCYNIKFIKDLIFASILELVYRHLSSSFSFSFFTKVLRCYLYKSIKLYMITFIQQI